MVRTWLAGDGEGEALTDVVGPCLGGRGGMGIGLAFLRRPPWCSCCPDPSSMRLKERFILEYSLEIVNDHNKTSV